MFTIVEVIWIDAWHESAEMTRSAIVNLQPIKRRTVGYLLKESDTETIVASEIIEKIPEGEDSFTAISIIPKGIIIEVICLNG